MTMRKRKHWWNERRGDTDNGCLIVIMIIVSIVCFVRAGRRSEVGVTDTTERTVEVQLYPERMSVLRPTVSETDEVVKKAHQEALKARQEALRVLNEACDVLARAVKAEEKLKQGLPNEESKLETLKNLPMPKFKIGMSVRAISGILDGSVVSCRYDMDNACYMYGVRFHTVDRVTAYKEVELESRQ